MGPPSPPASRSLPALGFYADTRGQWMPQASGKGNADCCQGFFMVSMALVTTGQASSGHFSLYNYSLKKAISFSLFLQIQTVGTERLVIT